MTTLKSVVELPFVASTQEVDPATQSPLYANRKLYLVEGRPGIFRRVSREGRSGLKCPDGRVVSIEGNSLIELLRDEEVETLLAQALAGIGEEEVSEPTLFG